MSTACQADSISAQAVLAEQGLRASAFVISPGAFIGGRCVIGADSLVGPLAKVLQGLTLGRGFTIGMGCNVLRALPDHATIWPRPDIAAPAPRPADPI